MRYFSTELGNRSSGLLRQHGLVRGSSADEVKPMSVLEATHRRSRSRRRLAGQGREAVMACCTVVLLCGTIGAVAFYSRSWPTDPARDKREAELSTGSVLFIPPKGDMCRERTIDNSTWRIRDAGQIDCELALARNAALEAKGRWSGSRTDIIRDSFRNRP
jgi:hypothetical protein